MHRVKRKSTSDIIQAAESRVGRAASVYSDIAEPKRWEVVAMSLDLGGGHSSRYSVIIEYITNEARRERGTRAKRTYFEAVKEYKARNGTAGPFRYPDRNEMVQAVAWNTARKDLSDESESFQCSLDKHTKIAWGLGERDLRERYRSVMLEHNRSESRTTGAQSFSDSARHHSAQ